MERERRDSDQRQTRKGGLVVHLRVGEALPVDSGWVVVERIRRDAVTLRLAFPPEVGIGEIQKL